MNDQWHLRRQGERFPQIIGEVTNCRQILIGIEEAVRAAAVHFGSNSPLALGMWRDGRAELYDYPKFLIDQQHNSLRCYIEDMCSKANFGEFCFSQFNLQRHSHKVYEWAILRLEELGVIDQLSDVDEVDVDVFLGRYKTTPRGIHRDSADTYMHILTGRKRLFFWSPEQISDQLPFDGPTGQETLLGYDLVSLQQSAVCIEAGPGDVIFWPAEYWHLCDNHKPTDCIALNIGLHRYGALDRLKGTIGSVLDEIGEKIAAMKSCDVDDRGQLENALIDGLFSEASKEAMRSQINKAGARGRSSFWLGECPAPSDGDVLTTEVQKVLLASAAVDFQDNGDLDLWVGARRQRFSQAEMRQLRAGEHDRCTDQNYGAFGKLSQFAKMVSLNADELRLTLLECEREARHRVKE